MKFNQYASILLLTLMATHGSIAQNTFRVSAAAKVVTSGNVTINYNGGTLTNDGMISNNQGSLDFSAPVIFAGTGTTTTNNLRIQHSGTSTLNNRINVAGTLEINNGSLDANNNLTLLSNAAGSAVIAPVAAGSSISGKITVQRYIPQGKRAFRFLSPGVDTDDFISNNWQLGTHITGSATGANGFDATASGGASMFTYNNEQAIGTGWTAVPTTNATNLQAKYGYRILIRGDRNSNLNAASAPLMNSAVTLTATGTAVVGQVVFDSGSAPAINNTTNATTNGYSLVGNPYVNTVDWNTLSKSGLVDAYYVWDANMGTASQRGRYVVYSSTTGSNNMASDVNRYIQPGQAFFVKNSVLGSGGTLIFDESNKGGINNYNALLRTPAEALTRLDLQVFESNELALGGYPVDAAAAVFDNQFTDEPENGDVVKLSSGTENISFLSSGQNFTIQARPSVSASDELLIQLQQFQPNKSYTFRTHFNNFDPAVTPYVLDSYTNQYTTLAATGATDVPFTTTTDAASYATNRFKIVFQNTTLGNGEFNANQIALYPNPIIGNEFTIGLPAAVLNDVDVRITNMLGQLIDQTKHIGERNIVVKPKTLLAAGIYNVVITNEGKSIMKKIVVE